MEGDAAVAAGGGGARTVQSGQLSSLRPPTPTAPTLSGLSHRTAWTATHTFKTHLRTPTARATRGPRTRSTARSTAACSTRTPQRSRRAPRSAACRRWARSARATTTRVRASACACACACGAGLWGGSGRGESVRAPSSTHAAIAHACKRPTQSHAVFLHASHTPTRQNRDPGRRRDIRRGGRAQDGPRPRGPGGKSERGGGRGGGV